MALVKLNSKEAARLEKLLRTPPDTRALKRAQALLWLNDGESVAAVAERLRISRQTVYNWGTRFQSRRRRYIGCEPFASPWYRVSAPSRSPSLIACQ